MIAARTPGCSVGRAGAFRAQLQLPEERQHPTSGSSSESRKRNAEDQELPSRKSLNEIKDYW